MVIFSAALRDELVQLLGVIHSDPWMLSRGLEILLLNMIEEAHPNYDKFINKKIDMFDEISLVYGNDRARGDCAKSFEDIDFECFFEKDNDNDIEEPSTENDVQLTEASQVKASCKIKRSFEVQDVVGDISNKIWRSGNGNW
ncbi:hypothetical protein FXO38_03992 [Capsicum annuum]|uniref:Uncharacterized protein n=1 Tax=Capsicum annuum TaxID=4072 RepID=A0A2G3ANU0_CAPAN|nr:hypothetical protein FXO38_03992 [Capsicum annuum]PHT95911.1 hypothetical protein T459_03793 [Capsicum annuum]